MDLITVVIILALAATSVALLLGLFSMSSRATNQIVSTPLMWARVGFQAFTLVLLIIAVILKN